MGLFNLIFRLGTDNTDFNRGLAEATGRANQEASKMSEHFEHTAHHISRHWMRAFIGWAGGHKVLEMGKELLEQVHTIDHLGKKFNLTAEEVQRLQQEAEETGTSFEDLVKNADELEKTLERIADRPTMFSNEGIEQLTKQREIVEGYGKSLEGEIANIISNPSAAAMLLVKRIFATRFDAKGEAVPFEPEAHNLMGPGAGEFLAREAARKRADAAEAVARHHVAEQERQLDRLLLTPQELVAKLEDELKDMVAGFGGGPANARQKDKMVALELEIERARRSLPQDTEQMRQSRADPRYTDALLSVGNFLGSGPDSRLRQNMQDQLMELREIKRVLEKDRSMRILFD